MAIYHLSAKIVSRSKGQSAVASASYRSGEKMIDERTGETKFYPREVQPETMILAPDHSPEWINNREKLWNEVEKAEKRKDSQLARELEVSFPVELSNGQQKELIKSYVQEQFVNKGMIADISIHRDDPNNPHAHIMLTTREITEDGFGKKNRDWNPSFANSKEHQKGFVNDSEKCLTMREQWAVYANEVMEREGINERIDHRSHVDRGLEVLPTQHLGHKANAMEKKGIETERGNYNRETEAYNKTVIDLAKYREERNELKKEIETKKFLEPNELVDIKDATKVINDKGKGFVSLDSIAKRKDELANRKQKLFDKESNLRDDMQKFKKANYLVNDIGKSKEKKLYLSSEIERIKDIKGVWQENKVDGVKKVYSRIVNFKTDNRQIERMENEIENLNVRQNDFEQQLEPYQKEFNFQSAEEFHEVENEFENYRTNSRNEIKNDLHKNNDAVKVLNKAEIALQRKEVREVISHYPELNHLSETMKHDESLKLKEINQIVATTVPVQDLKQVLQQRKNMISTSTARLDQFDKAKTNIVELEDKLNELSAAQTKIEEIESNPFQKGKLIVEQKTKDTLFGRKQPSTMKQEYDNAISQRDQIQSELAKSGITNKEELNQYKEKVNQTVKNELPKVKERIQRAKDGTDGISIQKLESTVKAIDVAERRHEYEQKKEYQKENYNEKERQL